MHQSLPSASDAPYFVPALPLGTAALHYLPLIYWLSEAQRPRTILHVGPYDPELERAVMEFVQSSSIDSAWRGVAPNDFSPSPGSLVLWSLNDHRDDSPVDVSLLSAVPDVVVLYFSSAASRFGSSTSLEAVTFDSPSWPCTVFALHDGAPHPVVDKLRSERELVG
jgi:hypothetical protein